MLANSSSGSMRRAEVIVAVRTVMYLNGGAFYAIDVRKPIHSFDSLSFDERAYYSQSIRCEVATQIHHPLCPEERSFTHREGTIEEHGFVGS
jgi:hypothetical protein